MNLAQPIEYLSVDETENYSQTGTLPLQYVGP
jgi:hypothetical protein